MDAEEHQSFRWRSEPSDAVRAVSRRLQRLPAHHSACKQRSVLACHCAVRRLRRSFPDCRWPVKDANMSIMSSPSPPPPSFSSVSALRSLSPSHSRTFCFVSSSEVEDQYTHAAFPAFFDTGWHILHARTNAHGRNPTGRVCIPCARITGQRAKAFGEYFATKLGWPVKYFRFIYLISQQSYTI